MLTTILIALGVGVILFIDMIRHDLKQQKTNKK